MDTRFNRSRCLTVNADLRDVDCDQQSRIALLRCTQESLANVRKHAAASTVGVVLSEQPFGVELEVTDDGRGFVVANSHGFGLDGMAPPGRPVSDQAAGVMLWLSRNMLAGS